MNRIVLVGNGYDLSCGLKSKYEHFLLSYLKTCFEKSTSNENKIYEDRLINIEHWLDSDLDVEDFLKSIKDIADLTSSESVKLNNKSNLDITYKRTSHDIFKNSSYDFSVNFNSNLFSRLLIDKNWTNVEGQYFKLLLEYYNNPNWDEGVLVKYMSQLNEEFKLIKTLFLKYLSNLVTDKETYSLANNKHINAFLQKCLIPIEKMEYKRFFSKVSRFKSPYYYEDGKVKVSNEPKFSDKLENVWFVNFNYTSILSDHLKSFDLADRKFGHNIINIHRTLEDPNNIIFGYGDDTHPSYKAIENTGLDELLENIKSFYYSDSKDYINLIDYLDDTEYEVFIIGHSLGLSDRVLLKSIFEHDNCRAIRLFYRDEKLNQFKKRLALSRHFDNKSKMRRKIIEHNIKDKI